MATKLTISLENSDWYKTFRALVVEGEKASFVEMYRTFEGCSIEKAVDEYTRRRDEYCKYFQGE